METGVNQLLADTSSGCDQAAVQADPRLLGILRRTLAKLFQENAPGEAQGAKPETAPAGSAKTALAQEGEAELDSIKQDQAAAEKTRIPDLETALEGDDRIFQQVYGKLANQNEEGARAAKTTAGRTSFEEHLASNDKR